MIDHLQLMDHLSVGTIVIDHELKIIFWNRWMAEHSLLDKEEVLNRKMQEIFPEIQKKGFIKKAREVFDKGLPIFFNNKVHRHMFPFHSGRSYIEKQLAPMEQTVILSALKNETGKTTQVLITIFDISDWIIYQNDLLKSKAELEKLSRTDDLTQVPNRRNILDKLFEELQTHRRKKRPISMAIMDIDHFKKFNDNHGHQCGDMVLHEMAQFITGLLRDYDILGRYGGEEFLLILPETTGIQAFKICDRIRTSVEEQAHTYGGKELHITVSIGIASKDADESISLDAMFKEADRCLYIAKETGRNRTEMRER